VIGLPLQLMKAWLQEVVVLWFLSFVCNVLGILAYEHYYSEQGLTKGNA
jgi:hypothetical protein